VRFPKKWVGTSYVEIVFLHSIRWVGHIVHFGASGARNVDALFFMLVWDRYIFHKKRIRTCYVKLVFCIRYDMWVT
jgi:hypothetical protein